MSVAEDTTQIPIPDVVSAAAEVIVAAVVNDLTTPISNTSEAHENATKTILEESQAVIDETTKLIEEIATTMVAKNEPIVVTEPAKSVADETAKPIVVDEPVKNIANIISEEEKRLTETISRLSIEMEKPEKNGTGFFAKIHKFVKLITSCTHGADKSVIIPVVVKTDYVDVKVANVV